MEVNLFDDSSASIGGLVPILEILIVVVVVISTTNSTTIAATIMVVDLQNC